MSIRVRASLAAVLALSLGAAVAPAAPAFAVDSPAAVRERGPNAAALRAAIAGIGPGHPEATAALVRVGGEGTWRGSAGVHDLRSGRPADPRGRFRVGSVTKVFVAAAVLQLAGERKLDLDAPVRRYLPDVVPAAYGGVTVRHLLNHTHGIPAPDPAWHTVEEAYAQRLAVRDPRADLASSFAPEKVREAKVPGTAQKYSNTGYTLAGLLVERVTGHSYESELTRRVIRPLGLKDTYLPGRDPRVRGPHNHGYQRFTRADGTTELRDVTVWSPTDAWAAGDLISTTRDLERFTTALFRGEVVRGPLLAEMFDVPDDVIPGATMSAGLQRLRVGDQEVWFKTGGRWGSNAVVAARRDLTRTLVHSVNATDAKGRGPNTTGNALLVAAFGP
ncbi:serine hydrolase domain-containing protein [Streptomyces sp. NPDC050504]|uniref:serine hydrolase domain-containing protein n=1 Tax=Streptomyces sp. NPDC050504 TaxID=3365618 RepID=UPI0037910DED